MHMEDDCGLRRLYDSGPPFGGANKTCKTEGCRISVSADLQIFAPEQVIERNVKQIGDCHKIF